MHVQAPLPHIVIGEIGTPGAFVPVDNKADIASSYQIQAIVIAVVHLILLQDHV